MDRPGLVLLAVSLGAGTLALVFWDQIAAATTGQIASGIALLMALVVVASGYTGLRRPEFARRGLRDVLIWLAVALALALLYVAARPYLPGDFG